MKIIFIGVFTNGQLLEDDGGESIVAEKLVELENRSLEYAQSARQHSPDELITSNPSEKLTTEQQIVEVAGS